MSLPEFMPIDPFESLPRLRRTSYEKKQQYGSIALLIIGGLGITAAAIGLARIGGLKNWWHADKLQALTQNHAIIMLSIGTPAGIVLIAMSTITLKRIKNRLPESRPLDFTQITEQQFRDALMYAHRQKHIEDLFDQLFGLNETKPHSERFVQALSIVSETEDHELLEKVLTCVHATPARIRNVMRHFLSCKKYDMMHKLLDSPSCTPETTGAMLRVITHFCSNRTRKDKLALLLDHLLEKVIHTEDLIAALQLSITSHGYSSIFKKLLDYPHCPEKVYDDLLLYLMRMPHPRCGVSSLLRTEKEVALLEKPISEKMRHTAITMTAEQLNKLEIEEHLQHDLIERLTTRIQHLLPKRPSNNQCYKDAIKLVQERALAHREHRIQQKLKYTDDRISNALATTLRCLGRTTETYDDITVFLESLPKLYF